MMRRDTEIKQHDRQDCAAACLSSVCAFYGLKLPLILFREACGVNEDGTSLKGIADACAHFGLEAVAYKNNERKISQLESVNKPVILHIRKENGWLHFIVLYEIRKNRIKIMDPDIGRLTWRKAEDIEELWTGYLLSVTPDKSFRKKDERTDVTGKIFKILHYGKRGLLSASLCTLAYIAVTLSTSIFLQVIIDDILPAKQLPPLIMFGLAMLVLAIAAIIFSYFKSRILVKVGIGTDRLLILNYFKKLFSLPISFFDSRSSGELNARISDAYRIRSFITGRLLLMAASIVILATSIVILFFFNIKLALITLTFIPLYLILYIISDKVNRKTNRKIIEESARMEEISVESISSIRAVQYFGAEELFMKKIKNQYERSAGAMYKGGIYNSIFASASDGISKLLTIAVLIGGSIMIFNSTMSVGELVSFFAITGYFSAPIAMLVESNKEIADARIASERLFDIMDYDEGNKISTGSLPKGHKDITIENLCFSYPGRKSLIENLNCRFECGKINLITGENGSGKSTLASLLMRGYSPVSGMIKIGDTDISTIPLRFWRDYITIVPQRPDIFNGTILENITMEEDDGKAEDIAAVCALSGIDKSLEKFPGGILTHTGERACKLSGGEKQKIAFARALYKKPHIIIMDEAMTNLDASGRKKISDTLNILKKKGAIIILISHEPSAIQYADNIIKLDKCDAHHRVNPQTRNCGEL